MRKGFTLIEMVFVIVIFGILSKFGAELLLKIYENYIYSNTYNRLQNQSELAVKQIANRLQYRIKDSTIARDAIGGAIEPIGNNNGNENVIEWMSVDLSGWRGNVATSPEWSGLIDLRASNNLALFSPGTTLNGNNQGIFFIGSDVNLSGSAFGWDGTDLRDLNASQANIKVVDIAGTAITLSNGAGGVKNFIGSDVYEYYQLTNSAYAVSLENEKLILYSDYKPWLGETAVDGKKSVLVEHVKSFKFTSMGDILVIQVCLHDEDISYDGGGYAVCKEKVVF